MRKDGVKERLKASRLVVISSTVSNPQSQTESHSQSITDPACSTSHKAPEESRLVADVRATTGLRGVPKSGRVWKRIKYQRFSSIRNDKPDTTTWESKVKRKSDKTALKLYAEELKQGKLEREKVERERILERRKQKLENQKKSEVVVPIKNVAKLKRMRKKQLRSIEKR